jgi:hypothetical protein
MGSKTNNSKILLYGIISRLCQCSAAATVSYAEGGALAALGVTRLAAKRPLLALGVLAAARRLAHLCGLASARRLAYALSVDTFG